MLPAHSQLESGSDGGRYDELEDVAHNEHEGVKYRRLIMVAIRWVKLRMDKPHPVMNANTQPDDHQDIDDPIVALLAGDKEPGSQPAIVGIEHHQHAQRSHTDSHEL